MTGSWSEQPQPLKAFDQLCSRVAILPEDFDGVFGLHRQLEADLFETAIPPLRLDPLDLFLLRLETPGERRVTRQVEPFLHRQHGGGGDPRRLPPPLRLGAEPGLGRPPPRRPCPPPTGEGGGTAAA